MIRISSLWQCIVKVGYSILYVKYYNYLENQISKSVLSMLQFFANFLRLTTNEIEKNVTIVPGKWDFISVVIRQIYNFMIKPSSLYQYIGHKSTQAVPIFFPKILVNFKIKNLTTCNCVKDWGKVSPRQGWGREAPAGLEQGMLNL